MKTCPVCDTDYPDQHTTCPTDGAVLIGSHELAPGSLVRGKYRIVCKLGEGGMGIVYLADDILLGVRVALKFLAGDLGKDPRFIKRFRAEARAAYQLRHPNVVEVTNLDQAEDGTLFIAMEYVEGPSLRTELDKARGGFAVPRVLEIARGITSGLAAAHAQATVHRDIKPENILLLRTTDGQERPKILDFGIAAVAESVTRMTRTHGFLLTPNYAAPEQWLEVPADEMDGRTDLYALGCVLYEMLTGSTPFHAHNTAGWMTQHLEETPRPPSLLRPELANWQSLDALVLRLLAKDRDHRPNDSAEMLSLLEAIRPVPAEHRPRTITEDARKRAETLTEETGTGPPETETAEPEPKPRRFPRWAWGTLTILILAASFAAWRMFAPQPQFQAPVIQPISKPELESQQPAQITNSEPSNQAPAGSGQTKSSQVGNPKPSSPSPRLPVQTNPTLTENAKPSVPKPAVPEQPRPTPTENPKSPVPDSNSAEVERQAETSYKQQRYTDAAPLYYQACAGGISAACLQLGQMYEAGQGVAKDDSRAVTFYTKACDADSGPGCNQLGLTDSKNRDYAHAVTPFSKACDANLAIGCGNLGYLYVHGLGVPKDLAKAKEFFSKGCSMAHQQSCDWLAELGPGAYWVDPSTGLMWAKKDNGGLTSRSQASEYCQNLRIADHSDWRLPTVDELKGIRILDPKCRYDACHIAGDIKLTAGWVWSSNNSSERPSDGQTLGLVFNFSTGMQMSLGLNATGGINSFYNWTRALCVRRAGN